MQPCNQTSETAGPEHQVSLKSQENTKCSQILLYIWILFSIKLTFLCQQIQDVKGFISGDSSEAHSKNTCRTKWLMTIKNQRDKEDSEQLNKWLSFDGNMGEKELLKDVSGAGRPQRRLCVPGGRQWKNTPGFHRHITETSVVGGHRDELLLMLCCGRAWLALPGRTKEWNQRLLHT